MIVEIKQTPDNSAKAVNLHVHGRSKLPNCFEIVQPSRGNDGRWITGLDEDSRDISSIGDPKLRQSKKEEVLKLRENLERLTGLDLSATSSYWETFFVQLKEKNYLDLDNPMDQVRYYVLIANRYLVPELELANSPDYASTKFYVSRTEEEASLRVERLKNFDKSKAELLKLSDSKNKLKLVAKYILGHKVTEDMKPDTLYDLLSEHLNTDYDNRNKPDYRHLPNVAKFLDAVKRTPEELQYKLVVDEAIARHIIRFREGYYQRGNATYGKNLAEVIAFLSSPENSAEFVSVKEETEEKRKFA